MLTQATKRRNYVAVIFYLYLGTITLLSLFSMGVFSPERSWSTFAFGLLLAATGTACCHLLLKRWEAESSKWVHDLSRVSTPQTENVSHYVAEGDEEPLTELREKLSRAEEKYAELKGSSAEEIERKSILLSEYQKTINEQREVIEKKQKQIAEFEEKVRDLNYDLNTLLQLTEVDKTDPSPAVSPPDEPPVEESPAVILKRTIGSAEKIAGAAPFSQDSSRFRDFPSHSFTLDLRRLFDALQGETSSALFVYSQREKRILFVTDPIKQLLGWQAEKVVSHLSDVVEEGMPQLSEAFREVSGEKEVTLPLVMKKHSGGNRLVHCTMGVIPRGLFRSHIIGVLTPA